MDDARTYGSNVAMPPTDLEALQEWLREVHADIAEEKTRVLRQLSELPATITNAQEHEQAINALATAARLAKRIKSARETAKAPFLAAGGAVDGYFKTQLSKPLTDLQEPAQAELSRYDTAAPARKREEARKAEEAARAEQRRKEEEAQRLARNEARSPHVERETTSAALRHEATEAAFRAEDQRRIANAKAADLTRTRTASGAMSTTRTDWDFEVTDPGSVHPRFKVVDDRLIRSAMNEQKRFGTIENYREPGIRFFKKETSQVRG